MRRQMSALVLKRMVSARLVGLVNLAKTMPAMQAYISIRHKVLLIKIVVHLIFNSRRDITAMFCVATARQLQAG